MAATTFRHGTSPRLDRSLTRNHPWHRNRRAVPLCYHSVPVCRMSRLLAIPSLPPTSFRSHVLPALVEDAPRYDTRWPLVSRSPPEAPAVGQGPMTVVPHPRTLCLPVLLHPPDDGNATLIPNPAISVIRLALERQMDVLDSVARHQKPLPSCPSIHQTYK